MKKIVSLSVLQSILVVSFASTQPAYAGGVSLPDDHAPIGVMGDHNHGKGEWMASYRYSRMEMDGNRDGDSRISRASVLNNFVVAPLDMTMEMHMFGLMYGASDSLTIMGMLPYIRKSMNHVNRMGTYFETETEGVGDFKLSGIYTLYDSGSNSAHPNNHSHRSKHNLLFNFGVSLPTGSVDERGDTPAGSNQKLPYPMQLGSGTFDPLLGLTYTSKYDRWSWGGQIGTVLRFGTNSEGYRLGNEYSATTWIARDVTEYASISFRLDGKSWGNIHGSDQDLNPMMVPTARTDLRGGERVDALVGLNLYKPSGSLSGNRLALEFGVPVYQRLDGPQLETDYRLMLGWQLAF